VVQATCVWPIKGSSNAASPMARNLSEVLRYLLAGCLAGAFVGAAAEAACPEEESVARLYSFHNTVQVRLASTSALESAFSDMPVCLGDTVEVGDRSRAHLVFLVSNESLTIEQNTEFVIERAGAGGTLIRIIRGAALFFARGLGLFEVETAPVNLNVEGTEFLVEVQPDRTRITVFEGVVRASNAQGEAQIGPNQFTEVQQGQAPVVQEFQIDVRPRDAVRWAVYYEPIMPLAPLADLDQVVEADPPVPIIAETTSRGRLV